MVEGLLLLSPEVLFYVFLGVVVSTVAAVIPGLGGTFAIAILLPFVFRLDPATGIAFIMAINVVNGTGNTITSILFGIPGSASGVASTFDGFPLTQRGEGIRAVSAGLTSSMLGGLIGAAVLALALPILRPIVEALRPPEFFALILLAVIFMSFVASGDRLKALISGALGMMLAFVGMEGSTGTQRWTLNTLYLWEGISLVPALLGLYAITEMVSLMRRGGAIIERPPQVGAARQTWQGIGDAFRHIRAVAQSSASGVWVGVAPGLGDAAAQFIGYAQVAKTSKRGKYFGQGEIEGVIAADAATNSKEGGALIPTLAFGIPGSSTYAIIIAAFLAFGIQPGPAMLTDSIDLVWMIIWILVLANIIGTFIGYGLAPLMSKLTALRAPLIVPPILVASMFGAFSANGNYLDIVVMLIFGAVGLLLKEYGYSRPIFLIGFVLGGLLESNYLLSQNIYGSDFFLRPITLALFGLLVIVIVSPIFRPLYRAFSRSSG